MFVPFILNFCRVVLKYSAFKKPNLSFHFFCFLAGIISLLEEPRPELKVFALRKLDNIVDEFWPEISEAIEKM